MSQTRLQDLEGVGNPEDGQRDHSLLMPNQTSQGRLNFGDSSGKLFSIYSKAAEDEDNKMVERWQKDADGILIFTGLFSAAVAALLAITVQDLRPNSQDTSAFYLGNIYQVLADPNVTRPSISSPVAKPPPFSPPRYAVLVNSFWFLSLVMSLSCAFLATSLHQWARRYIRLTQPDQCTPEKRARFRAFFANGVRRMHVPWVVEGLPTLLHLSLFFFFGGLGVFLFNVDHEVFSYVICWIGLFSILYGLITLLPLICQDSPYSSPLSTPTWFLYTSISYATFKILAFTSYLTRFFDTSNRCVHSMHDYRRWMSGSVEKAAKETASELSSEIDTWILDWTISALGDDNSLKDFFEAIPGFFNSTLVKKLNDFPDELLKRLRGALHEFLDRTWSSNSVSDSEKLRRIDLSMKAIRPICVSDVSSILFSIFFMHWDEVPHWQTVKAGHILAHWCTSDDDRDSAACARSIIARILQCVRVRDDSWVMLAARVFGLRKQDLRDNIALGGDNVLLAILTHISRQSIHSGDVVGDVLETLSKFDIHKTHPTLQHEFCMLWNEIVQKTRDRGPYTTPVRILKSIRRPYIALHQGTDSAPTAFCASSAFPHPILYRPSSYPLCTIDSHRPARAIPGPVPIPTQSGDPSDAPPRLSTHGGSIVPQQVEKANIIAGPSSRSNLMTTSKRRETS